MLTKEELNKYAEELRDLSGKKDGIVYLAKGEIVLNGQKVAIDGAAFTFEKERGAVYPGLVANLICNRQEAARAIFVKPENWGDPVETYKKGVEVNGAVFDIKDIKQFCKDFDIAKPNVELYKQELKAMEANLEGYKQFLKDNEIEV